METLIDEIIELMKEGDSHFVLAVGNKNDWIAMLHKDEVPDEPVCWGVSDNPYDAVNQMLMNAA